MSVSVEADLYDFIKDSIRHWVGKNFGSQEVEEPSWNIEDLSAHLTKKLNKREQTIKSLKSFDLCITLSGDISDEDRAKLMGRVMEKLDRIGGSLTSITYSHETRNRPIKGETDVVYAKIKLDIPANFYALRGFNRWLERQEEGHDLILTYMLEEANDNSGRLSWTFSFPEITL